MDAQLIEKLDKSRYRATLLLTIGIAVFFMEPIAVFFISGWHGNFFKFVMGLGAGVSLAASVKLLMVYRRGKGEPELDAALNNEMHTLYNYKSLRIAFWSTLSMVAAACLVHTDVPTEGVCLVILTVSLLIRQISWLVYNKR